MIIPEKIFNIFQKNDINFFTGVPDSLLKDFCAYVTDHTDEKNHIIAANEGGAVALATGYHLATGKVALVYMQNSGLGNAVNPLLSLADKEVYRIPIILMIGWRGEPGAKDESQHIKQGRVLLAMLDAMEIPYQIIDSNTFNLEELIKKHIQLAVVNSAPVALVVRTGTFEPYGLIKKIANCYQITREEAIGEVLSTLSDEDIIVATTGKISREVFEYRERMQLGHQNDFLTVGSMGHASQIAFGLALKCDRKIVCLDGDGAVLMHLGSLSIIGSSSINNFIHIVLNNGVHDSVGGQPTVGFSVDLSLISKACGYREAVSINKKEEIKPNIQALIKITGPVLLEIRVNRGSRSNLGRPNTSPLSNKFNLMKKLVR